MDYQGGEMVLLSFPFTDTSGARRRPALVLLDTGDEDMVVARITSQTLRTTFEVEIMEWQQVGLLLPSVVRLDKVATPEKNLVERRLGRLSTNDWTRVRGGTAPMDIYLELSPRNSKCPKTR